MNDPYIVFEGGDLLVEATGKRTITTHFDVAHGRAFSVTAVVHWYFGLRCRRDPQSVQMHKLERANTPHIWQLILFRSSVCRQHDFQITAAPFMSSHTKIDVIQSGNSIRLDLDVTRPNLETILAARAGGAMNDHFLPEQCFHKSTCRLQPASKGRIEFKNRTLTGQQDQRGRQFGIALHFILRLIQNHDEWLDFEMTILAYTPVFKMHASTLERDGLLQALLRTSGRQPGPKIHQRIKLGFRKIDFLNWGTDGFNRPSLNKRHHQQRIKPSPKQDNGESSGRVLQFLSHNKSVRLAGSTRLTR